ncbi:hypothetical protein E2P84_16320 [Burkholderia cepacia]|uniref:DUF1902 domain-containing protein n=1 Tax=Burkholderia cepacia TaxID=292 RepID=A0AAX2RZM9_BURCE|nr:MULTISPECIES: hypothetical protein [Burkholderia]MCR5891714.1 hypothetical protein [Burkholderia sp. HAN2018]TES75793.1 hypothetical protein E2P84_16320 [Burkholderia cepacia]TEU38979.1 hypothetical protein E3D39_22015 [Burkholderia cepacia]TEU54057.1 hypothetical protein E3D37_03005 [Burkholderia cepacia]TEU57840.1 hypothetical protein E3D38_01985 [Burkholderia cepacia]
MYRFIRTATVKNAAQIPSALAFAAQVTAHLNKSYAMNMQFGVEQFGSPRIHWYFDADSLDKMQQINEKLMADRDYGGLLEKYRDVWVDGATHDTVVRLA